MARTIDILREAALHGEDQLQGESLNCPPPVGSLDDVIDRLTISDGDREIVRMAYVQACNTVKLCKLQKQSALVMEDRAQADQFDGAMRRAARAVLGLERDYPWLREQ